MDAKSNPTAHPITNDALSSPEQKVSAPNTEKKASTVFRELLFGLATAALGYLCEATLLPFGARPFGIALLCSADRRVFYLYAGLCLSAWQSEQRILLLLLYSSILVLRALARLTLDFPYPKSERAAMGELSIREFYPHLYSEHLALRVCLAGVAALSLGLWTLFTRNFLFYDLYGTILSITVCTITPLILSGIFTKQEVGIYRYVGSMIGISAIVVFSLNHQQIWGISLPIATVMGVTLYITRRHGVVLGALSGTLLGLLIRIELAPAFAFAALAAGLLFSLSRFLGLASAFSLAIAWSAYVDGLGILNGTLSGMLCATVLFSLFERTALGIPRKEDASTSAPAVSRTLCQPLSPFAIDSIRLLDTKQTVKHLCESFSSLSDALFTLSQKMQTPTAADLRQICDKSFDASCASCFERNRCWGEKYHETSAEIGSLCAQLRQNGKIELTEAPTDLAERCIRLPDIIDEINHRAAQHQKQLLQNDRTEIFATDYRALSNLLDAAMGIQDENFRCEDDLTKRLCETINQRDADLGIRQAAVLGAQRRYVRVIGEDREMLIQNMEEIQGLLQSVCPFPLASGILGDGEAPRVDFPEAERLEVICAQRSICADEESVYCGDTTGQFSTQDGRYCALISDGMGSGREASLTSGLCAVFLQKLIRSGSSCDMALNMLNEFLRNRGSSSLHECSSTIDLLSLDLLHAKAYFYKCGAAPTYIFRDGNLFKIRSHTVPLGIIAEADTRKLELSVSAGDVIVMVSDGVTQSKEECPWLFDLLRSQSPQASVERLADLIVKYAKGEGCSDDISVLVTKIVEPQKEKAV